MAKRINTNNAAKIVGVQPQTMRAWRCRGRGPRYTRLGGARGRCVYNVDELERWLAERTYGSTSEEAVKNDESE